MKLPELDVSLAHKVTTITAISTSIFERIQSPTSNSITTNNLTSQIDFPFSEQQQQQQEETTKNPTSINLSLKHRKTSSISSLNSIISLNSITDNISKLTIHNNNNNTLNDFHSNLFKKFKPWIPFIVWVILSIITLCIFLVYRKEILLMLEKFAHLVKSMGIGGWIIFYLMIFLTTFPLIIGYSTLVTLSGFTFGFSIGFFISYMAALTGGITVFYLSRKWFRKSVRRLLHKNRSTGAIIKAVEEKGFKV